MLNPTVLYRTALKSARLCLEMSRKTGESCLKVSGELLGQTDGLKAIFCAGKK